MPGLVLRSRGGVYDVETEAEVVEAVLRGRLKRETRSGERVVVGDRVTVSPPARPGEAWAIERVEDRVTALVRRAPGRAPRPKIIVANVDRVVIVFSVTRPDPHLRMLDRFLVLCENSGVPAVIVANKTDLLPADEAADLFRIYRDIGYPVILTSASTGEGIEDLRDVLAVGTSALTGPSGVGKSSLLNRLQPGLGLRVGSVSSAVNKGRHTTVTAELIRLDGGGYVADTPGLRELGLWDVPPESLDTCFPEFVPFLGNCRFGTSCTHSHEPGCRVSQAADAGLIAPSRFGSYLRMLAGDDVDE